MIIFTVTNKATSQVYVGSTRNDLIDQWEKMVAAAEQNLDYPLYQEIRAHGRDGFIVEEFDYVDDRNELNQLEQDAINFLQARSLRGYKTSTVKIQPRKRVRARKSTLEKELSSLIAQANHNATDNTLEDPVIGEEKKNQNTPSAVSTPITSQVAPRPKGRVMVTGSTPHVESAQVVKAIETPEASDKAKTSKPAEPDTCSQANAIVQMNGISLSDDISSQLAAINAAASAVLAGKHDVAALLKTTPADKTGNAAEAAQAEDLPSQSQPQENAVDKEIVVNLNPRERRIRDAVERHRKVRAQKTSDNQAKDRQQLRLLLSELNARASDMSGNNICAVA